MTGEIERIEAAGFVAWSPDEQTVIDGWTVSSSGGYTRRLNSAVAVGSAGTSLATRDRIAAWLAARGASLTVRVTPLLSDSVAQEVTATWGLQPVDRTFVMSRSPVAGPVDRAVLRVDPSDRQFEAELMALNGRPPIHTDPWRRIVARIGSRAIGLWVPGVAVGFTAEASQVASVFSVAVAPEHRRRGWATAIMAAAENWAVERDADTVFLQVLGTNRPARTLYRGLGFADMYAYHYLQ